MFERCLLCHSRFKPNQTLEHFPVSDLVSYDPDRGRLWAICRRCRGWNLIPIESRWEAIEELEDLATQHLPTVRADQVALFTHSRVSILRIGVDARREEAWRRYGGILRRQAYIGLVALVGVAVLAVVVAVAALLGGAGLALALGAAYSCLALAAAAIVSGSAWAGTAICRKCHATTLRLTFKDFARVQLVKGKIPGVVDVRIPCYSCGRLTVRVEGAKARQLLKHGLSRWLRGGLKKAVEEAEDLIAQAGSAEAYLYRVARQREELRRRSTPELLALEIALNEESERSLLLLSLEDQMTAWREEEELARITDGELTPWPRLLRATGSGAAR